MESKEKQSCSQGAGKKELPSDSGQCHGSIAIGNVNNRGTETGGEFSKVGREAWSWQHKILERTGKGKKENQNYSVNGLFKLEVEVEWIRAL